MSTLPADREEAFWLGAAEAGRFFMGQADPQRALERLVVVGRGYRERVPGGRGLRDLETGVDIDVVLAGEFPDPAVAALRGKRVALLPLEKLVELKLASGISAPHRLKDLADVLELIRSQSLPRELRESLDASVRPKWDELWEAAQARDPER